VRGKNRPGFKVEGAVEGVGKESFFCLEKKRVLGKKKNPPPSNFKKEGEGQAPVYLKKKRGKGRTGHRPPGPITPEKRKPESRDPEGEEKPSQKSEGLAYEGE